MIEKEGKKKINEGSTQKIEFLSLHTDATNLSNAQREEMGEGDVCTALYNGEVLAYSSIKIVEKILMMNKKKS